MQLNHNNFQLPLSELSKKTLFVDSLNILSQAQEDL